MNIKTSGEHQDNSWDEFTPKVALNYNFTSNITAFAGVSKGYRSGGFSIDAGFGYSKTEFDQFRDELGDYEGNKNPWAPEYTFHIGGQYRHDSGFFARVDLIGFGEVFFDN